MDFLKLNIKTKKKLGLSTDSLYVLQAVHFYCCNTNSNNPGWCAKTHQEIADDLVMSKSSVSFILNKNHSLLQRADNNNNLIRINPLFWEDFTAKYRPVTGQKANPYRTVTGQGRTVTGQDRTVTGQDSYICSNKIEQTNQGSGSSSFSDPRFKDVKITLAPLPEWATKNTAV